MKRLFTTMLALGALIWLPACSDSGAGPPNPADLVFAPALGIDLSQMTRTPSGLYYQDLVVGGGQEVQPLETVTVHYEGWLHDGAKFDSSRDRGMPATICLCQVIQGWREGIPGMREGGRRKLVVPSNLGYGSQGAGNGVIPPNATLVFDVEVLGIGG